MDNRDERSPEPGSNASENQSSAEAGDSRSNNPYLQRTAPSSEDDAPETNDGETVAGDDRSDRPEKGRWEWVTEDDLQPPNPDRTPGNETSTLTQRSDSMLASGRDAPARDGTTKNSQTKRIWHELFTHTRTPEDEQKENETLNGDRKPAHPQHNRYYGRPQNESTDDSGATSEDDGGSNRDIDHSIDVESDDWSWHRYLDEHDDRQSDSRDADGPDHSIEDAGTSSQRRDTDRKSRNRSYRDLRQRRQSNAQPDDETARTDRQRSSLSSDQDSDDNSTDGRSVTPPGPDHTSSLDESVFQAANADSSVLVVKPPSRTGADSTLPTIIRSLEHDPVNLLLVMINESPSAYLDVIQRIDAVAEGSIGIITVGSSAKLDAEYQQTLRERTGSVTVKHLTNPSNVSKLGILITKVISNWETNPNNTLLYFHTLSALQPYLSDNIFFQFLHTLQGFIDNSKSRGYYRLDPTAHEDLFINTYKALFESVIRISAGGDGHYEKQ